MSDEGHEIFKELNEFARELKEEKDHYGYPYNIHNPRYNLNLVSSETLDELIKDMLSILSTAFEYRKEGWELTEPVRFGKIELHYDRDGKPHREDEEDG